MCTEIQSFSFSLDTKESEKPASAVADVRRNQRILEKEVWYVANSWEGACSTSGCWSSAYSWASTEGWRGRHVILFAPTLPLVSHLRVWQCMEWSFWTDIESSCSSWWTFHMDLRNIFNTLSMGRMHISWIKTIASWRRRLLIRCSECQLNPFGLFT